MFLESVQRHVGELVRYRGLIGALLVRHLSMRYRGSMLGFLWSILTPLCLMLVYTLVFKFYMRAGQNDHYAIALFCGLLPWIWFSSALQEGTSSIVASGHLITKSLFPPHILPLVSVLTTMVNFLLSLPLLVVFMLVAGIPIRPSAALLPIIAFGQFAFLYGMVLALGALNVYFRDVQHILGNFLTFLFFLCPIVYSANLVPEAWRFTLDLNPAALLTIFYHQILIEGVFPSLHQGGIFSLFLVAALLVGGVVYGRYREGFAELL